MRGMTRSATMTSGLKGSEPFQRIMPVGRDLNLKVATGEHGSQGATLPFVIVDDEDPARN